MSTKLPLPTAIRFLKSSLKVFLTIIRKPIWCVQRNRVPLSSYIQSTSVMRHCRIGNYCYISAWCGLNYVKMGNYCSIGPSVLIGNMEHDINSLSTSAKLFHGGIQAEETIIGNDVWIGAQAFIKIGIKIGDGAVIGAQSFVNKDVPPYSIVVGTPARIVRYRFDELTIKKIQNTKYWEYKPEKAKQILSEIS